jgi:hypothetical protein
MAHAVTFSNEQIAAILAALPDPAFILTRSGYYAALFGGSDVRYYHDGSALVGKSIRDVLPAEKADWFISEIGKALNTRILRVIEYTLAGGDVKGLPDEGPEATIWFEGRIQALDYQVMGEDAVLWVANNVTASKALEAKLRRQSETDALTGLPNRRKLMSSLTEYFETFVRYATPTSVLIFDIDNFKRINDDHGHPGLSELAATDSSYEEVLKRADDALYQAKREGRNRIIRH